LEKWKEFVINQNEESIAGINFKEGRLCSQHFKPEDYLNTVGKRRLRPDSIPTLHSPR